MPPSRARRAAILLEEIEGAPDDLEYGFFATLGAEIWATGRTAMFRRRSEGPKSLLVLRCISLFQTRYGFNFTERP
jgi:hypothetical protein